MKKQFSIKPLFPVLIFVLFLTSCEKNQKYCFSCEWDNGMSNPMIYCDWTESDAEKFEINMTYMTGSQIVYMNCTRQ